MTLIITARERAHIVKRAQRTSADNSIALDAYQVSETSQVWVGGHGPLRVSTCTTNSMLRFLSVYVLRSPG